MDIELLADQWRKEADNQPRISSNDVDIRLTLRRCADQLALAWHFHMHDGEFKHDCRFCDWEREHSDRYAEEGN